VLPGQHSFHRLVLQRISWCLFCRGSAGDVSCWPEGVPGAADPPVRSDPGPHEQAGHPGHGLHQRAQVHSHGKFSASYSQEQLTRLFGQNPVLMSRQDTPDTASISGLKCTATVNLNQFCGSGSGRSVVNWLSGSWSGSVNSEVWIRIWIMILTIHQDPKKFISISWLKCTATVNLQPVPTSAVDPDPVDP